MMRELQMDLTKYLKKDVLYNDLGFSTGKSTQDLINEMQAEELLVDFLEISMAMSKEPEKSIGINFFSGNYKC